MTGFALLNSVLQLCNFLVSYSWLNALEDPNGPLVCLILVNLALADEAVTVVCIPLVIGQTLFRLWLYGDALCKLTGFMQGARSLFNVIVNSNRNYVHTSFTLRYVVRYMWRKL